MKPELRVNFCGIEMKNPLTTASGTFHPESHAAFYDLGILGACTIKGVADKPWPGNPTPRIAETYGGMLNSVGLMNPGADAVLKNEIPFLRQYDTRIIVNLAGHTVEEYQNVASIMDEADVDLLELNISCPNIIEGGAAFGTDARMAEQVTSAVRKVVRHKPLIVKLSPNVTDITEIAKAVESGGADAVSLINTLLGMRIDIHRRKEVLANKMGGLSGPAIKPVGVRMVYQVHHAVKLPIIGMGGIRSGEDVVEYIMAGAVMTAIGTQNLVEPGCPVRILKEITDWMEKEGVADINEIRGAVE